jgi:hypothetical protein
MTLRFHPYNRIPVWENKRRVRLLQTFRDLVIKHDGELHHDSTFGEIAETDESLPTRQAINLILDGVDKAIDYAGVATTLTWTPPPMVGGYVQQVPVITNLFHLHDFHIPIQQVLDFVDRASGIYTDDQAAAWVRTCNPFFWLGVVFDYLATAPFRLARRIGFTTRRLRTQRSDGLLSSSFG